MELQTKDPNSNPPAVGEQVPGAYPIQQPWQPTAYPTQPQPQAAGQPPPALAGQTVVTAQPVGTTYVTMPMQVFSPEPRAMQCTNCGKNITTETRKANGAAVWVVVGWICLMTIWCCMWPFAFIPLCMPSLKDTIHSCPECKFILGKHSPGGASL
ncbi:lipopolysaccharide-induced tumor necrosis factor-alpha factor homolog [Acanthaster planci]|uniref:Lipopolysaccharide-induced tumor necrosis factor-alpha factor homolog n=1 Tax=Acanthaster planci TaxID=133434 RepID=A0A8B7YIR2_ACAPL|nr:lipopolysaccharide-induced tumor necrosis factor-alpha factor homolog [Acanthaster planci]XP_022092296.1 lipopolysaccharide-induced tumor necrosis factor-alpha factor homolog [Acanthaster planci]